jgi:spore coat protein H
MNTRISIISKCLLALAVLAIHGAAYSADKPKGIPVAESGKDVFGMTKIWEFHIAIPAKEYEAMTPSGGNFPMFGPPGGPPKSPEKPADKPTDVHKGGSFGMEFPWAHGEFAAEGQTFKNVGLRYKGGGSHMMSMRQTKRNLKVDLDRYSADQRFHGLKALNLNAGAADPTRLREALAFAVYRDAGVPTPRTAFAEVTLTVPGKFDKELLGTYTLIEQVDKNFLKDHFKTTDGVLMKPEVKFGNMRGPLGYLGDDWAPYKDILQPKHEPTKKEAERIIAFLKLLNRGTDDQFRKEIESYLDVDEFLRFLAVTSMLVNLDSFFTGGHNAYIYLHPETNKLIFIPWDLDLSFGGFFLMGQPDQQADTSLTHPFPGEHKLVDRVLGVKEFSDRYQKILKELAATCFSKEKLLANLEALEKATKEPLARETKAVAARKENNNNMFAAFASSTNLKSFIEKRSVAVAAQLEGKSKGTIPGGFGFGRPPGGPGGPGPGMPGGPMPGGPGMTPPRPGEVIPAPVQNALQLTDEQKKKLAEIQKAVDEQVEKLLTPEQRSLWKRIREGGPGPGPGGFPGGPPKDGRQ